MNNALSIRGQLVHSSKDRTSGNGARIFVGYLNPEWWELKFFTGYKDKTFEINAVEVLYTLPINSFTLINDEKNNIYLAKIKGFENDLNINNNDKIREYTNKQNSNVKNTMLKSYDLYLNSKYKVDLNQKTIERVKNYFQ